MMYRPGLCYGMRWLEIGSGVLCLWHVAESRDTLSAPAYGRQSALVVLDMIARVQAWPTCMYSAIDFLVPCSHFTVSVYCSVSCQMSSAIVDRW